jgi:hypothetical protein
VGYKQPFSSIAYQLHCHIAHPNYRGEQIDRGNGENQKVESLMKVAVELVVNQQDGYNGSLQRGY